MNVMEEQWIDNLRQRFKDRQTAAPEGLWDSIETAMTDKATVPEENKQNTKRAKTVRMWLRTAVAAAACIAVLIGVGISLTGNNDTDKALTAQKAASNKVTNAAQDNDAYSRESEATENVKQGIVARTAMRLKSMIAPTSAEDVTDTNRDKKLLAANNTENKVNPEQNNDTDSRNGNAEGSNLKQERPASEPKVNSTYTTAKVGKLPPTPSRNANHGVTMSVYGVGLTSTGTNTPGSNGSNIASDPITSPFVNSGLMLMASPIAKGELGRLSPEEVHVKHRQPVKVGMSARFPLNEVLSVETGLYYTYLSSDFERGDNNGGSRTEQRLHFIGLPVRMNASLWKNNIFDIYAGAGGAVEIGVSGTRHTERMENTGVQRITNESMREKRPQFSVNAAAGVQYNVNGLIGIYAEPGVAYYINNKSGIKTFYTDKPWNFNLSLGLRFTFR